MTVPELIQNAGRDGLTIKLSDTGGLTYSGNRAAAEKWLPGLRACKTEILAFLKQSAGTTADTQPEPWDVKARAIATGTTWRPADAWFLRRHIPDASMDEIWAAYWLTVGYVGTGTQPERAKQCAISDIRLQREGRNVPLADREDHL